MVHGSSENSHGGAEIERNLRKKHWVGGDLQTSAHKSDSAEETSGTVENIQRVLGRKCDLVDMVRN